MANNTAALTIVREFDAPKEMVFKAFANAAAMAEWWGPVEYPTTVLKFDFRPNGIFHFKMQTPDQPWWGRFIYVRIEEPNLLEFTNAFCDEHATVTRAPFSAEWPLEIFHRITFTEKNGKTTMTMTGYPVNATARDNEVYVDMHSNMNQGYNATFDQLEQYINAQFKLRKELKKDTAARTSTYLNFPGNTEEAFKFYQSIFKTAFNGKGIQRFGDLPASDDQPSIPDSIKKMVLHVELPLLGGHILMGTDAPKEMGFTVNFGNNSFICLEPSSRIEAKRLFDALAEGGNVTEPLKDIFWGAYYGSCVDKFGVSWMINCIAS